MSASAAVAWIALVVLSVTESAMSAQMQVHSMTGMAGMPMPHPPEPHGMHHSPLAWTAHWVLMVVAMMWPLYGAAAAGIASATFRRWQVITVVTFVAVMTALWIGFGWAARAIYLLVHPRPAWWAVAWLAVAIASTRSLWRAKALQRCLRLPVLVPFGGRAIMTASRAAAREWPWCLLLCGPVMVAMVSTHSLVLMVGGSAAVWWEQRHPRTFRDSVPVAILVATTALVVATILLGWSSVQLS